MTIKEILKNQTNGRKYMTAKIKEMKINETFRDKFIEEVLNFHPTKCLHNLEYLVIRNRPPYNQRSLYFKIKDEEEDDISYVMSIKNFFGNFSHKKNKLADITFAFRNSIWNTKRQEYFLKNTNDKMLCSCEDCGKFGRHHIDHFELPFKKILSDFLTLEELDFEKIEVEEIENSQAFVDINLKEKWIEYHDEKAIFKLLCSHCNLSKGSYGF